MMEKRENWKRDFGEKWEKSLFIFRYIICRGGQTVIRFKTEPKTEITENRKRPKMKTETETESRNATRKTENN